GNALIPAAAGLVRPQVEFPGPTSVALAYFTAFSGFSGAAAATELPYSAMLEGGGTATFGGTLADIFRFVEDDATLLAPTESANFTGELIAPFAVDTDDDETPDANVTIETTTAFVPLNASLPADASGDVIPYHVAFGTVLSTELMDGMMVPTLTLNEDGTTGKLDIEVGVGMGVTLNSTTTAVILPDLVTDNGVIHVISEALVPPSGD
ncbi:MAG: fasciclin domain-containing protein, partial [Myxococcota bacterium]